MPIDLVLISGLPAAGKSTLAARLGRDLSVPVVNRDRLRRSVLGPFEDLGAAQDLIPDATGRLVIEVAKLLLDAGITPIIDGNFNTPEHAEPLLSLIAGRRLRAAEVCLWGDAAALRARFIARADPPLTELNEEKVAYFERVLNRERKAVLPATMPTFHFDTTDFSGLESAYARLLDDLLLLLTT